jgi:cytochrome c oxidase assembly protein subunit 15
MKISARHLIGYWLLLGVFMIFIQVLLGGITRLTGSGLSITEWNLVMGTLPPLSTQAWDETFNKYKEFPQYKIVNSEMTLAGFKSIFWVGVYPSPLGPLNGICIRHSPHFTFW